MELTKEQIFKLYELISDCYYMIKSYFIDKGTATINIEILFKKLEKAKDELSKDVK